VPTPDLTLDPLPDDDARTLLVARISDSRVVREPEAVNRLVALCSGYPLALSIIAGRAVTDRRLQLSALVDELRSARLDALDEGGPLRERARRAVAVVPGAQSRTGRAVSAVGSRARSGHQPDSGQQPCWATRAADQVVAASVGARFTASLARTGALPDA